MKNLSLDQIQIPEPCTQSWDAMKGGYHRRFCTQCNKQVHDLSTLPRDKATALLAQDHLCVQFRRDHAGRVLTAEDIRHPKLTRFAATFRHGSTRILPPFLLAAFSLLWSACSRSVFTTGIVQPSTRPASPPATQTIRGDIAPLPQIKGEAVATTQPTLGKPVPQTQPAPILGGIALPP